MVVACVKKNGNIQDSNQDSLKVTETTTMSEENEIWDESEITAEPDTINISTEVKLSSPDTRIAEEIASKSSSGFGDGNFSIEELRTMGIEAGTISSTASRSQIRSRSTGYKSSADLQAYKLGSNSISEPTLGFSVGGAKDINNFRENIKQGFMPVEEDITHEGIFYDYFFDNNITKQAEHLFEPSYTSYKKKHPLTDKEEIYLSVGLNSNIPKASFKRKKLNLTVVLDISGSMTSSFDQYHYSRNRNSRRYNDNSQKRDENFDSRSKMEIAKECVTDLTKHLNYDDRFAVVLFNSESHLAKPLTKLNKTNMDAIRQHISELRAEGGTNMYAGINTASELYDNLTDYDAKEYDNRIIFLTDAMPNTNVTDKNSLWGLMKVNAERRVYTTFVGIGVDLNSELINYITKTPGANYYAVHNAQDFKKRMDTQFDYMVTPLVFDLTLHLNSKDYEIEAVYGSPEANQATGEIMKVNTLFPSETEEGKTRGGIILMKLKKIGSSDKIDLTVGYKDRNGVPFTNTEKVTFSKAMQGTDNGIRKAVLLSRYVNLMHDWINNKTVPEESVGEDDWQYNKQPNQPAHNRHNRRSKWERGSRELAVSPHFLKQFKEFKKYFAKEATAIKDDDLRQELDLLDILVDAKHKAKSDDDEIPDAFGRKVSINDVPNSFFGKWYANDSKRTWIFGITKSQLRTGNKYWDYTKIIYAKQTDTYKMNITNGSDTRTYYFRIPNARSMYYSSDNVSYREVVKH